MKKITVFEVEKINYSRDTETKIFKTYQDSKKYLQKREGYFKSLLAKELTGKNHKEAMERVKNSYTHICFICERIQHFVSEQEKLGDLKDE
jgi:hypothetical protein